MSGIIKVKLDTSWGGSKRTERLEIRCSKNLNLVNDALIKKYSKEFKGIKTKADLIHHALKELAKKEGILLVGDDYYI